VLPAAVCVHHHERHAIGICVKCRTPLCGECVTKVDGINYCVRCLERMADASKGAVAVESKPSSSAFAAFAAFGLFLLLTLLVWAFVEAAMPGSG
jgi:hypothetical protein